MPVISGIHHGRFDALYGTVGPQYIPNINVHRNNGLSLFDGTHTILYDGKKYILYARANLSRGNRYIQYATSTNLINWSPFNIIDIKGRKIQMFTDNFYFCNFFMIGDQYYAIVPLNKKVLNPNPKKSSFGEGQYKYGLGRSHYVLMHSFDGIHWNLIKKLVESIQIKQHQKDFFVMGPPIVSNDGKQFYFYLAQKGYLKMFTIPTNRISCISSSKTKGHFRLKYIPLKKHITINAIVKRNGYIKAALVDGNNKYINGYTFKDFNIIKNIDSDNIILTWKKQSTIRTNNVGNQIYIEIQMVNAKLYSIDTLK